MKILEYTKQNKYLNFLFDIVENFQVNYYQPACVPWGNPRTKVDSISALCSDMHERCSISGRQ